MKGGVAELQRFGAQLERARGKFRSILHLHRSDLATHGLCSASGADAGVAARQSRVAGVAEIKVQDIAPLVADETRRLRCAPWRVKQRCVAPSSDEHCLIGVAKQLRRNKVAIRRSRRASLHAAMSTGRQFCKSVCHSPQMTTSVTS